MSAVISNADPAYCEFDGIRWHWTGHRWGCGHFGVVSDSDDVPDCCEFMAEWKRRFVALVVDPAPVEPDPYSHEELRWQRVCQRIAAKHGRCVCEVQP